MNPTQHYLTLFLYYQWLQYMLIGAKINKCSAVAEMGDRLATTNMGQKLRGAAMPPFGGSEVQLGPHVSQCGLGRGLPLHHVAS